MTNHKKRRAVNRRAGCKLCRPWKINGIRWYKNAPAVQRILQETVKECADEAHEYNHPYYGPDYEDDWWDDQGLLEFLKEYNVK